MSIKILREEIDSFIGCGWSEPKRKTGVVLKCPVMIVSVTVVTNMCDHDQFMTNTRCHHTNFDQLATQAVCGMWMNLIYTDTLHT